MRYAIGKAVKMGYATTNVARDVEMPPEPTYEARPFESWEEVRLVASKMKKRRDQALVLFACATGLRPQEWQALEWRDIDIPGRVLRVNRTVQDGKVVEHVAKTKGALRKVRLDEIAASALQLLPRPLNREERPLAGDAGGVLNLHNWRRGAWKKALTDAGLPYREPYGMRDTFATLGLEAGAPLEWISEQMGHSEIGTTRTHYARWTDPTDDHILKRLNAARAAKPGLETDSAAERSG